MPHVNSPRYLRERCPPPTLLGTEFLDFYFTIGKPLAHQGSKSTHYVEHQGLARPLSTMRLDVKVGQLPTAYEIQLIDLFYRDNCLRTPRESRALIFTQQNHGS